MTEIAADKKGEAHAALDFSWPCDAAAIADAIRRTGCAVVRGAIPPAKLVDIRDRTAATYDKYDALKARNELPPTFAWTYKFGVLSLLDVFADYDSALRFIVEHGQNEAIRAIAKAFFASDLKVEVPRIVFRRQVSTNRNREIPYHQDFYTQTEGVQGVLNFWTPFIDCGVTAPSVEVVTHVFDRLLPTRERPLLPQNESFDKIHITREQIIDLCGDGKFWHPRLNVGDFLIFSDHVVHRTYMTEDMTQERQSIEYRVIGDCSILPSYQGPKDRFVRI
ncbi:hypothetical protein [Dongia sp.]|uniref:hypothetical protein n=1 Tax=Dongia sp. TaxID=1977262 RepID=UPI0035AF3B81